MNAFALSSAADETITVTVRGDWSIRQGLPSIMPVQQQLVGAVRRTRLESANLGKWDSALVAFLLMIESKCKDRGIDVDTTSLPPSLQKLIELARAAPGRAPEKTQPTSFLARIGTSTLREGRGLLRSVEFVGESLIALGKVLRRQAKYRTTDLFLTIQECSVEALPIVSIISLLVGMILAFVGAVQLRRFGADIYDANLVAVAMTREMAAIMTAIVLAGRTGAAFAAQIAAMQGNEEIDALSTLGISPIEFLVMPRMLALVMMTPLLCIYADLMGILGGFLVGINTLDVTSTAYLMQTQAAVTVADFAIGIVKASVFGALVAVTGCLRGIEAGRSAADVGAAATSAVVSGILAIIIADAIFAVLLNILGM